MLKNVKPSFLCPFEAATSILSHWPEEGKLRRQTLEQTRGPSPGVAFARLTLPAEAGWASLNL